MRLSKPVSVLLVEEAPADAQRIQVCLRQFKDIPFEVVRAGGPGEAPKKTIDSRSRDMDFEVTWVRSLTEGLQKITEIHFDILVLDLSLLDAQGLSAIRSARQTVDSVPIIVLIDRDDIDFAQTKLQAVAKDYIVKDESGYGGLVRAMRYVLHRTDLETRNPLLVAALEATSNAKPGVHRANGLQFSGSIGTAAW
jgi:DNA-binding response OmpR family regulator